MRIVRLALLASLFILTACSVNQAAPPVLTLEQQTNPHPAATPEHAAWQFFAALHANNYAAAEGLVADAENQFLARLAQVQGLSKAELWAEIAYGYTKNCAVTRVQLQAQTAAGGAALAYTLSMRECLPMSGTLELSQGAGWRVAKVFVNPTQLSALRRGAQAYLQNVYKAAMAHLAENPGATAASVETPDCTRSYRAGDYAAGTAPAGLLSACTVSFPGQTLRVAGTDFMGNGFTLPAQ